MIAGIEKARSNGRWSEFSPNISFMAHDFLTPQPVLEADIFMFRFVMHDWSDKYAVRILQNLLPAMKQSTRILIMDFLLGVPGVIPKVTERLER